MEIVNKEDEWAHVRSLLLSKEKYICKLKR